MRTWTRFFSRWLPAVLMMLVIFIFSGRSSADLPDFASLDMLVKKGGHILGYALLALAYWRGFGFTPEQRSLAWVLAILYAISDEVHQSFVPGRNASVWDVAVFDNLGALIALWLANHYGKQKRPGPIQAMAEQAGR